MKEPRLEIQINLAALQARPLRKLQRLVDVLEFSQAGGQLVSPDHYPKPAVFFSVYPSNNTRLPLAEVRTEAEKWFALHTLRDAIEAISLFIEDARRCCALYRLAHKRTILTGELDGLQQEGVRFHRLGLPLKCDALDRDFGVRSDFASHIISLNQARNCLVHRDGVVTPLDANDGDQLTVTWTNVHFEAVSPDGMQRRTISEPTLVEAGWTVTITTGSVSKSFQIGEAIAVTYGELFGMLLSHMGYVNELSASVQRYAEGLGFAFPAPKPAA